MSVAAAARVFGFLLLLGGAAGAQAQLLISLVAEPANAVVGQAVEITADFEVNAGVNCGIRLRFSDGSPEQYHRLNQTGDVPLVVTRSFDKPGKVTVWAEPRTKLPMFKCGGKDLSTTITVAPRK